MIILFFLFCAAVVMGVAIIIFNKNQAPPVNRYRKTKRAIRSQLTRSAQSYSAMRSEPEMMVENIKQPVRYHTNDADSDYVLGLKEAPQNKAQPVEEKQEQETADFPVVLYLMAPENCVYGGYELLQALLSAGLRYGKQRIFHRHTHKDGRGDILFHCASAMNPGTFDLTKIGAFTSKGLCLFFSANAVEDPLATFDCMLETLDQFVEELGGQVLDDQRKLLTKDKMVQYRKQLRTLMNHKTTSDLFR